MPTATSLPQHLHAQHRQRLALGRVDLARHDRAARFVLGHARSPRARSAGPRPASARRWRSCAAPWRASSARRGRTRARSCPASAANLLGADRTTVRSTATGQRATRPPNSGCVLSPVPTAVPPIASSRQPRQRQLDGGLGLRELRHVAREFLPERERRRVLQVRAADLDDRRERLGLRRERRRAGAPARGSRSCASRARRGDVHRSRKHVVARTGRG